MPCQLIAECGVNFDSFETAFRMIDEAKRTNADFVKFQLFNEETIKDSPIKDRLQPLILSESMVKSLWQKAKNQQLGFILTPIYPEAVDIATKYADYIKIRYADHENEKLIDQALDTGKPLLISVPSRPISPMVYNPRVHYLYCIPHYPPRIEEFNLEGACACHGFSSHFPHTICDLAFAINRSFADAFIEKHVMLSLHIHWETQKIDDETLPELVFDEAPIDANVSITFEKLKELISQIKLIDQMQRIRL